MIRHKWLPSEPTGKLLDLCYEFASNYDCTPEEVYKDIFNAAPVVEQNNKALKTLKPLR